ncbi:SPL family radical SAM protein [Thermococcus barophilus]|uniref:Radical SAM domain protein n=1 Tax=Thermococcus barophilus (strain DSM 11836 / MP) TaxID=391623 RepID=F0LLL0_THEBM|nr:radical SAM protein [Thermococcus barophilus]ADT83787.1 radical SAM domain protein [Thermococcus barophilus MP]
MRIVKTKAKSIYTKSRIPGVDYVINQYVGCQFACKYCYAKFICKWKPYGEWGSWIEVKVNAPELARKYVEGGVVMSSISDPYQPIEAKVKLTRRVLQNMSKRTNLSILTKSPLVTRDVDIFRQFKNIEVGLTVNSFEGKEKKLFEPLTPIQRARINALKLLHEEGIKTYAFISPIIPGITDVEAIVRETKSYADYFFFEVLNLRASGKEFQQILRDNYPESYETMVNDEKFWRFIKQLKEEIKRLNVKTEGIEIHKRGWEFIQLQ